jgi:GNAT superfamily N-acetyltransferase
MEENSPIRIVRLDLPVDDRDLLALVWHKGSPWVEDIHRRLQGQCAGSRDRFFVGYDGPRPVALVWYTVAETEPRLGLLGHVYTRPEHRRRGLATRLMETAMADFARQGGVAMQLFTYNPETLPFYERLGFETLYASRVMHAADWYLRSPAGSKALIDGWFAPRACRVRPLAAGDLPQYCLLYNLEHRTRLKDRAQEIGLGLEAELAFIHSLEKGRQGKAACLALDNGRTIVGSGGLAACGFPHQSHVGLFDYYTHPGFSGSAGQLAEAALAERQRLGLEIVYALCVDEEKGRTFAALGFEHLARLPGHYRVGEELVAADLYRL